MGENKLRILLNKVALFLNYWILGTRDTQGHRRRFSVHRAWETATIIAALNKKG